MSRDGSFGDISSLVRSKTVPGTDTSNGGLSRKGSFVSMKRATSASTKSTVSQKGFVFQGAGGGGGGFHIGEESQNSNSTAWGEYKSSMTGTSSNIASFSSSSSSSSSATGGKGEKRPSLSTALWTSIAASKFKKNKN